MAWLLRHRQLGLIEPAKWLDYFDRHFVSLPTLDAGDVACEVAWLFRLNALYGITWVAICKELDLRSVSPTDEGWCGG